jgi:hypothetical protein
MQERAKLAGGELSIGSSLAEGTRVTFRAPGVFAAHGAKGELNETHSRTGR